MSARMQMVHDLAARYDRTVRADDPRLRRCVHVRHEDGTTLWFENAFLMDALDPSFLTETERASLDQHRRIEAWKRLAETVVASGVDRDYFQRGTPRPEEPDPSVWEIGYVVVFTEHCGFHVFARGDLSKWAEYTLWEGETLELRPDDALG